MPYKLEKFIENHVDRQQRLSKATTGNRAGYAKSPASLTTCAEWRVLSETLHITCTCENGPKCLHLSAGQVDPRGAKWILQMLSAPELKNHTCIEQTFIACWLSAKPHTGDAKVSHTRPSPWELYNLLGKKQVNRQARNAGIKCKGREVQGPLGSHAYFSGRRTYVYFMQL